MGYWAQLDNNRVVTQVVEADEEFILSGALGNPNNWVETSLTGEFRKNYAGIGYLFREDINSPEGAFVPPCPGDDHVLNENTGLWEIPS